MQSRSEASKHAVEALFRLDSARFLTFSVSVRLTSAQLNYLSHLVVRLYEDVSKPLDDPLRFYVNVQFSPGAALDPFVFREAHTLPVSRPVPINGRIPWSTFKLIFGEAGSTPPRGYVQPWLSEGENSGALAAAMSTPRAQTAVATPVVTMPSPRR